MTLPRMDNVAIVVEDLAATVAFFAELGLKLENEMEVEGPWVDQTVGLDNVRSRIAWMRAPDSPVALREVAQYEQAYRLCYVRGPEGIIVALAEKLG